MIFDYLLFVLIAYYLYTYFTQTELDIVNIEDIDMVVVSKSSSTNIKGKYYGAPYINCKVHFKGVDDDSKKFTFHIVASDYHNYNRGDVVTMQEVFYKGKKGVFSEIVFATSEHYARLKEYLDNNNDINVEI